VQQAYLLSNCKCCDMNEHGNDEIMINPRWFDQVKKNSSYFSYFASRDVIPLSHSQKISITCPIPSRFCFWLAVLLAFLMTLTGSNEVEREDQLLIKKWQNISVYRCLCSSPYCHCSSSTYRVVRVRLSVEFSSLDTAREETSGAIDSYSHSKSSSLNTISCPSIPLFHDTFC
jgi:hypothetical protein